MKMSTSLFAAALAVLSLSACHRKSDKVVQSCYLAGAGAAQGSTATCKDETTTNDDCLGEQKKSSAPCPRENVVGGCKEDDYIQWYYSDPSKGYATLQTVRVACGDKPTLAPDGSPATGTKSAGEVANEAVATALKTHGPKAKATLTFAASLAGKLPAPTGHVDLGGAKGNAIIVHKEDLGDPEHPKSIPYRLKDSNSLGACSRMLAGKKLPSDMPDDLAICADEPFLAVVSVSDYTVPSQTDTSVSGNTKTTYMKKGHMSGDVFVFRLRDDKYLGSYSFHVENSEAASAQTMTRELLDRWVEALGDRERSSAKGLQVSFYLDAK